MQKWSSALLWVAGGDLAALVVLRDYPESAARNVRHADVWIAAAGLDAALATLAGAVLWLAAAWLGLGLLAAAVRRVPGATGRVAGRVCETVLPGVLRRLVVGSAGLGVLLAPLPATAAPATATPTTTPTSTTPAATTAPATATAPAALPSAIPASPSPATTARPTPTADPADPTAPNTSGRPARLPAPIWPRAAPTPDGSPTAAPPRTEPAPIWPSIDAAGGPNTHPIAERRERADPAGRDRTTVRAGDCLWLIAARRLGPHATDADIAAAWPRWYAANRGVVGADPDLIVPGQVLHAPSAPAPEAQS